VRNSDGKLALFPTSSSGHVKSITYPHDGKYAVFGRFVSRKSHLRINGAKGWKKWGGGMRERERERNRKRKET